MNTPNSMAVGWGALMLAGGVAYYYAKKDINDRRDREHKKRLSHTSGVALTRHQAQHKEGQDNANAFNPGLVEPVAERKYRLASGNSTEGRDRGDRL